MTGRSVAEWVGKTPDSMPGDGVRDRISARQDDKCANPECRRPFGPQCRPQCDHIVPLSAGGENRERNLQMLCTWCHVDKSSAEATPRAKSNRIRRKHLGITQVKNDRWNTRPLGNGNHQHTATRQVRHWIDEASE